MEAVEVWLAKPRDDATGFGASISSKLHGFADLLIFEGKLLHTSLPTHKFVRFLHPRKIIPEKLRQILFS